MADRSGQVVVVLGGSGGLGFGLAGRLAAEGAQVVLSDIEESELARAADVLADRGAKVLAVRTDVVEPAQVDALAQQTLDTFGRVDLVCNTVGVESRAPTWELPYEDWRWVFDVNFWGVVHVIRSFVPTLIAQGDGHIVHTSSTVALTSRSGNPAYMASKHAVLSICETLQQDLWAADSAVKVSVIIPGAIRSRMYDAVRNRQAQYGSGRVLSDEERAATEAHVQQVAADPDALAEVLLTQLDAGRFYLFGRDDDIEYAERRLEGLRDGFLPLQSIRQPRPGAWAGASEPTQTAAP